MDEYNDRLDWWIDRKWRNTYKGDPYSKKNLLKNLSDAHDQGLISDDECDQWEYQIEAWHLDQQLWKRRNKIWQALRVLFGMKK